MSGGSAVRRRAAARIWSSAAARAFSHFRVDSLLVGL
jgi:hypothetical protein